MKPSIESLPPDLAALEKAWPRRLARIMTEIHSPADPAEVEKTLGQDPDFMALVQGWERMPTASQAHAWNMIQDRLFEAARATRLYCLRCGECCRQGSPVLFQQDRRELAQGAIRRADLVTLRKGQRAWSSREGKSVVLEAERVKLREIPGARTCVFLSPGGDACLIYDHRPLMCRILECWDPSRFDTLGGQPPLDRRDLLGEDNPLWPLIERHEERTGLEAFIQLLAEDPNREQGPEKAVEMILFDLHVRRFTAERFQLDSGEMDFLFGRPLVIEAQALGFSFQESADGVPVLIRIPKGASETPDPGPDRP